MLLLALALAVSAPPAEEAAIFAAAGFTRHGGVWKSGNCDGMEGDSYAPGNVETYRDLNGDGSPEAVVTEGGAICFGMTGTRFWLLSQQATGGWKLMHQETAMPGFLAAKGAGGWPDIELGGPGFCFPVVRWNGTHYEQHRFEYEGKACRN